jgi:hypothetical protein
LTPARRALESPIAIACLVDLAPCFPLRMCSISSCTNSPAWVDGDLPCAASLRALLIVPRSGIEQTPDRIGQRPMAWRLSVTRRQRVVAQELCQSATRSWISAGIRCKNAAPIAAAAPNALKTRGMRRDYAWEGLSGLGSIAMKNQRTDALSRRVLPARYGKITFHFGSRPQMLGTPLRLPLFSNRPSLSVSLALGVAGMCQIREYPSFGPISAVSPPARTAKPIAGHGERWWLEIAEPPQEEGNESIPYPA